jgi:hypothetical protein
MDILTETDENIYSHCCLVGNERFFLVSKVSNYPYCINIVTKFNILKLFNCVCCWLKISVGEFRSLNLLAPEFYI